MAWVPEGNEMNERNYCVRTGIKEQVQEEGKGGEVWELGNQDLGW